MAGGGNAFAATAHTTTDEPTLTLRSLLRDLRRSLRIVLVLAVLGVVGGIAYTVVEPAMPTASSYVLLPASGTNADGQPIQDPQTYAQIILSPGVLDPAAKAAGLQLPFQTLQRRVSVTAVTPDDLQITVRAASGEQAIRFANATSSAFLTYANNASLVASEAAQALGTEKLSVQKAMAQTQHLLTTQETLLEQETASGSTAAAAQTRSYVDQLNLTLDSERSEVQLISTDIATQQSSALGLDSGAVELQHADWATLPSLGRWLKLLGLGLLIGLLVGIIVALVRGRIDSRLSRRDEIAAAAGVPVVSSVVLARRWRSPDFGYLLDGWAPSVTDSARYGRLLQSLPGLVAPHDPPESNGLTSANGSNGHGGRDGTLTILEKGLEITFALYSGDRFAQAVAVRLAAYAASIGLPVVLVLPDDVSLGLLSGAIERRPAEPERRRRNLEVAYSNQVGRSDGRSLRIHLLVLDKSEAAFSEQAFRPPGAVGTAVLVVSAGFATREQVADAGEATSYEHLRLAGVVVANPEPSDSTTGRWVPPGAALQQRLSSSTLTASRQP